MTKNRRAKVIVSAIILFFVLLLAASFLLELTTPPSTGSHPLIYSSDGKLLRPPFPSSLEHPLGTDKNGNDLLKRLIVGFKYTFIISILVTLLRLLISIIGSFVVLYFLKPIRTYITAFLTPFLYVPTFILFFYLQSQDDIIVSKFGSHFLIVYQILIIIILGTPPLLDLLLKEFEPLLHKDYTIASRLLGASNWHISTKQIFPVFKNRFYIVFIQQTIATIILLIHLGVLEKFIGGKAPGGIIGEDDDKSLSQTGEWAGMIGQSIFDMVHYPWLVLYPACAVIGIILLLNVLIKQVEEIQK